MSKICIAPGEYFEHTHSRNSISHVISGKIDISLNGVVVEMSQGEEINIPAHCPHSFQNSSTEEVVIGCSYGP
jgi:quercetin dioxygenase-like cupin family protein